MLVLLLVAAASGAGASFAGTSAPGAVARARVAPLPARKPEVRRCPIPERYRPAFEAAARDTGLPLPLLVAVGRIESNLRHEARSHAGARGVLQVMPGTAAELGLDVADPAANTLAGARYLRSLLDRFGSSDLALAAYNAGPTAVESAGGAPTGATLTYIANVTALWKRLGGCR